MDTDPGNCWSASKNLLFRLCNGDSILFTPSSFDLWLIVFGFRLDCKLAEHKLSVPSSAPTIHHVSIAPLPWIQNEHLVYSV